MSKDPAFLFYPADFQIGTEDMTDEQVGKYIRLMCRQHLRGHIAEEHMLKICGTYDKDIYDKFIQDESGLFYNPRLEAESEKRRKYSESRSNNRMGKTGQKPKPKTPKKTKDKPEYMAIPDCEYVLLTQDEHNKIIKKWGEVKAAKMIEILDAWLGRNTKNAIAARGKDHYGYFRKDSWVSNNADEELKKLKGTKCNYGI